MKTLKKSNFVKEGASLRVRLLVFEKGKILLLKQTKPKGGNYTLIGGKVEQKELIKETIIREAKEEAEITVAAEDLKLIHVQHRIKQDKHRVTLFFRAKKWEGIARTGEPHKFKRVEWHDISNLPLSLTRSIQRVLEAYKQGENYSEIREW